MICTAISALNEPDESSKQAISRYIERSYTGIPPAHGALLTHHLKTLKKSGVLVMVKKSYKLAATTPPTSIAAPPPRSDFTIDNSVNENQPLPDLAQTSTPKRGRGRPPKPKADDVQANGKPTWEQNLLPVSRPRGRPRAGSGPSLRPPKNLDIFYMNKGPENQKKKFGKMFLKMVSNPQILRSGPGPRKDGALLPTVKASVSGVPGRERKPAVASAPASSVFTNVANGGVRRRRKPKRVDAGVAPLQPNVESGVVVMKRGRGRPPKIRKTMKQKRGYIRTGRPAGRPRKNAALKGVSGQKNICYGE